MLAQQVAEGKPEELEVECRFCNTKYSFTPKDVL
jgi:redox-regulated HSP33 family molecular chaperone